jgi:hypothetical protein
MKTLLFAFAALLLIAGCAKNKPVAPKVEPEPTVTILAAPASIQASKGVYDDRVIISWPKTTSAKKYQVYKSTNVTSGFEFFKETPDTTVTDMGGDAHVNSYYKVKVYNTAYEYSVFTDADFGFKLNKTYSLWYSFGGPGAPDSTRLLKPMHIAADTDANMYIADDSISVIRKFTRDGKYLLNIYMAPHPHGMLALKSGNLFTTNISPLTASISIFHEDRLTDRWGWGFQGDAKLDGAEEVTEDDEGHVYVVDGPVNIIKKYSSNGLVVLRFDGTVKAPGQTEDAYPFGITYFNKELFVTSPLSNIIRVYDKAGNFKRSWDAGSPCYAIKEHGGWLFIAAKNYIIKADVNGNIKEKIGMGSFAGGTAIGLAVNSFGEIIATDVSLQKVLVFRR